MSNEQGEIVLHVVQVPDDFDFDGVALGDSIEFSGAGAGNGSTTGDGNTDGEGGGNYCADGSEEHPGAARLVDEYGVSYQEVIGWFCTANGENGEQLGSTNSGFGEIKLALETAQISGGTADELLAMRDEGLGWGQIWKELGFTGKPKEDEVSGQQDTQAEDDNDNGQGSGADNSNGNGPPDHANNDKDKGKGNNGKGNDK